MEPHRIKSREGGEDLDRGIEDGEDSPTTPRSFSHKETLTHQNTAKKPTQLKSPKSLVHTNTLDPPPPPETDLITPLKTSHITTSDHKQWKPGE